MKKVRNSFDISLNEALATTGSIGFSQGGYRYLIAKGPGGSCSLISLYESGRMNAVLIPGPLKDILESPSVKDIVVLESPTEVADFIKGEWTNGRQG